MQQYKKAIDDFKRMKTERSNWDTMYQVLGEYVSQIKQDFQGQPENGAFLTDEIFDSTAAFAAYASSSALLGMLWPRTAKQNIEIHPPEDMPESTELAEFYEGMTKKLTKAMDDPKANLTLALDEYMLEEVIFGTSGIGVDRGEDSKFLYKSYGVKELYIDEGKNGKVNKIAIFYEWDAVRVVEEYGDKMVSEKIRQAAKKNEKVKILIMIQKRVEIKAEKGKYAMPFESLHLAYDDCHLLREEGFFELPIAVVRFRKLSYEKYGRSSAMSSLPDIKEANALREAVIVATEKALDMPKGIIDDGMLGGGTIDTSARAINVFNASANIGNSPPIFDIGQVPNIEYAEARLEKLEQTISQHFNIDRLIDFNNETEMTFGEAQIRDQLRTASLGGLFSRQISEGLTPVIERSINMMWRDGDFGVMPNSQEEADLKAQGKEVKYFPEEIQKRLQAGEDVYEIRYKTKAASAARAEEYISIIDVMSFATQAMAVDDSVKHRVNLHEGIKTIANIRALPVGIIRQDDEVDAIIQAEQQQLQQMQQLQMAEQAAGAYEKAAKGDAVLQ